MNVIIHEATGWENANLRLPEVQCVCVCVCMCMCVCVSVCVCSVCMLQFVNFEQLHVGRG